MLCKVSLPFEFWKKQSFAVQQSRTQPFLLSAMWFMGKISWVHGASREGRKKIAKQRRFFSVLPKRLCAHWLPSDIPMRKGMNLWRLGTGLAVQCGGNVWVCRVCELNPVNMVTVQMKATEVYQFYGALRFPHFWKANFDFFSLELPFSWLSNSDFSTW